MLSQEKMDKCLINENYQDQILNERIDAQKKYKIDQLQQFILMKKYTMENMNIALLKKQLKNKFK